MADAYKEIVQQLKHYKYATFAIIGFLTVFTFIVVGLSNTVLRTAQTTSSYALPVPPKDRCLPPNSCKPQRDCYYSWGKLNCGFGEVCCSPLQPSPTPSACAYKDYDECSRFCQNPSVNCKSCGSAANYTWKCTTSGSSITPPATSVPPPQGCANAGKQCSSTNECNTGQNCQLYECNVTAGQNNGVCELLSSQPKCQQAKCDGNKCRDYGYNPDANGNCSRKDKCGFDPAFPDVDCGAACPNGTLTQRFTFDAAGYKPGETVSTWIGFENGSTKATQTVYANNLGRVTYSVASTDSWLSGTIRLVAHGRSSNVEKFRDFSYYKKCK